MFVRRSRLTPTNRGHLLRIPGLRHSPRGREVLTDLTSTASVLFMLHRRHDRRARARTRAHHTPRPPLPLPHDHLTRAPQTHNTTTTTITSIIHNHVHTTPTARHWGAYKARCPHTRATAPPLRVGACDLPGHRAASERREARAPWAGAAGPRRLFRVRRKGPKLKGARAPFVSDERLRESRRPLSPLALPL